MFKSELQNTRLPCGMLRSAMETAAFTNMAYLIQI
jgi:hypothetical protein